MLPNRWRSGQNGIPSSHPWRFGAAFASGRNEYGVGPRRGSALELTAGKPERPAELQVVAGGGLPVTGRRACEVVTLDVANGGPGDRDRRGGVDR